MVQLKFSSFPHFVNIKLIFPAAPARLPNITWIGGGDIDTLFFSNVSGVKPKLIIKYIPFRALRAG